MISSEGAVTGPLVELDHDPSDDDPATASEAAAETVPVTVRLGDVHPVRRGELIALADALLTINGIDIEIRGMRLVDRGGA